jgi:hypothetical protein
LARAQMDWRYIAPDRMPRFMLTSPTQPPGSSTPASTRR